MALQVINFDHVGAGLQVNLGNADDGFIATGVVVGSTDGFGVSSTGNDQSLNVLGTVVGATSAIDLGLSGNHGQHLSIGADGYVANSSTSAPAVMMRGVDNTVDNAGTIHGQTYGLEMRGGTTSDSSSINNSGLIEAGDYAIYRVNGLANNLQTINLHNTGEIRGGLYSYYSGFQNAADHVTNDGVMKGDVFLGLGQDKYDGSGGGRVIGDVFGGDGQDQFLGGDFGDRFFGGNDQDAAIGGAGADHFEGGADQDQLAGGGGDDQLWGGDDFDQLWGNAGNDILHGDAGNDHLFGEGGNDFLDGGAGADEMDGGDGNDSFIVDLAGDVVIDSSGVDEVSSSVDFNFSNAAQAQGLLENLVLTGVGNTVGIGNAIDNTLTGNAGDNLLLGMAGNDMISGGNGNDRLGGGLGKDALVGGLGNDRLSGGLGKDTLTGGLGNDQFVFDVKAKGNADMISDFQHNVDDMLMENAVFKALGGAGNLKAGFFYAGKAAHDANDHIIYNKATGALFYDDDGTGAHAQVQFATLAGHPGINAHDFLVI